MKGMDMKGMDMKGMDMKGMDTKHSDHEASPAEKIVCDRLKSADMSDPLMQALAEKCVEQAQPGDQRLNRSSHTTPTLQPATPGVSPAVEPQNSSGDEHYH